MTEGKAILYIAGTLLLVGFGLHKYFQKQKFQKIAKSRPKLHKFEFIKTMETRGYKYAIVDEVYDAIHKKLDQENFDMYPEDDILKLYKFHKTDVEEIINQLLEKLDLISPREEMYEQLFEKNKRIMNSIYVIQLLQGCDKRKVENN